MGVEHTERALGLRARWTPFPLHPEVPEGGVDLDAVLRSTATREAVLGHARRIARGLGLPFRWTGRVYPSRKAQELALWAEHRGAGRPFRRAVFRALFAEDLDIGDTGVLLELCGRAGLDPAEGKAVLEQGGTAPAVDAAWARARRLGVRAVPFHRLGNRTAIGFHEPPALAGWARDVLQELRAERNR